jgi:hypothetical protein
MAIKYEGLLTLNRRLLYEAVGMTGWVKEAGKITEFETSD